MRVAAGCFLLLWWWWVGVAFAATAIPQILWSSPIGSAAAILDAVYSPLEDAVYTSSADGTVARVSSSTGTVDFTWMVPVVASTVRIVAPLVLLLLPDGQYLLIVAVDDDTNSGRILALNPTTQTIVWQYTTLGPTGLGLNVGYIAGTPQLSLDGTVLYVCQPFGAVTALDTSTGTVVWQVFHQIFGMDSLTLSPDGSLLYIKTTGSVQLGQDGLHSMDAANGLLQESQLLTTPITDPLADNQNNVYVTNLDNTAVSYNGLDLQNGAMWTTPLNGSGSSSSGVFAPGMHAIHVPAGNHTAKVQASTGQVLWSRNVGGPQEHSPQVSPDGRYVVCLVSVRGEPTLKKLDALNGVVEWSLVLDSSINALTGEFSASDTAVYVGSTNGHLLAVEVALPPPTQPPTVATMDAIAWRQGVVGGGPVKDVHYAAGDDDVVFVATTSAVVHLSPRNGAVLFSWTVPPPVDGSSSVEIVTELVPFVNASGTTEFLVVGVNDGQNRGRILSYSPSLQTLLWELVTNGPVGLGFDLGYVASTPRLNSAGTQLFACQTYGPVMAINATSGSILWQQNFQIFELDTLALSPDESIVVVKSHQLTSVGENGLHAFDASNGLFLEGVMSSPITGPTVDSSGATYVTNSFNQLARYNAATLQMGSDWITSVYQSTDRVLVEAHPVVSADLQTVYAPVGNRTGKVEAATGFVLWSREMGGVQSFTPQLSTDGMHLFVLVENDDGSTVLRKLMTETGDVDWSFRPVSGILTGHFSVGDRLVFVGTDGGEVLAIRIDQDVDVTPFPSAATPAPSAAPVPSATPTASTPGPTPATQVGAGTSAMSASSKLVTATLSSILSSFVFITVALW